MCFVGWLCLTSKRQRGHLEMATPFTVPCEGHEAQFLHRSHREWDPGPRVFWGLTYVCFESLWFDDLLTAFTNDQIKLILSWAQTKQWHIWKNNNLHSIQRIIEISHRFLYHNKLIFYLECYLSYSQKGMVLSHKLHLEGLYLFLKIISSQTRGDKNIRIFIPI